MKRLHPYRMQSVFQSLLKMIKELVTHIMMAIIYSDIQNQFWVNLFY